MQLEELLEQSASRSGDKTALVTPAARLSYRELDVRSNRLAWALLAAGLQRGERVLVQLDNGPEAVISMFAVWKAAAVLVMIHPSVKPEKLRQLLDDSAASIAIVHAARVDALRQAMRDGPLRRIFATHAAACSHTRGAVAGLEEAMADGRVLEESPPKRSIDVDLAALLYTSGSTGAAKGVMLSHLNVASAVASITGYLENRPDDVIVNVLPLSFGYGLSQVLTTFACGATLVLEPSFAYPARTLDLIAREKATGFPMIPTMSSLLLQLDLGHWDLSSLRYITNAAAAWPVDHIRRWRALLPSTRLYSMYGLAECLRASYLPPEEIERRPESIGRGIPNVEVFLVDEHGHRAPPGVAGELVVRGANVMQGYWGRPEETAAALRPGPLPGDTLLFTGDLFRADEEGYLYFLARKDDVIKSRGEKISPREIEDVLYRLPAITEAAVIGVPDNVLGMAVKAVVALRPESGLTEQEVRRHCAAHLEEVKVPKWIEIRPELPKTATGKISRRSLRDPQEALS